MARPRGGSKKESVTSPEPDARARLITAGYRVLAERGYDATTVKEVAREAGVNQGLVHYYFGSKDALLLAVAEEARQQYMTELRRLREETPPERLAAESFAWGERLLKDMPEQFRVRYELFAMGLRNKELKSAVAESLRCVQEEVSLTVARVRQGQEDARPEPLDVHYAAIMKACVDGLSLHHLLDASFDPAPVYALLSRIILASLELPEAKKPPARKPRGQARRGKVPAPRRGGARRRR
ncbi:TetR/AcrR family transcriptional regulator [Pyxidicoccus fallax]|uniref:TetR family transcriptional regulator n=1 Tax=Pyxidicoccus fallax TaxID=394095 RepID=A0A848LEM7_9BACT|nr:TetR/AcrR family transcriptional regulator [Pyxidicoccus fallax]NMO16854.1 TetR family transcriptional regulator [Pyxidicoccus fallax]NPC83040.1 TetR/AcrR family transcriptional regulator [Pyxidicoccus fallax]